MLRRELEDHRQKDKADGKGRHILARVAPAREARNIARRRLKTVGPEENPGKADEMKRPEDADEPPRAVAEGGENAAWIASDADYVDYITELMGGFAIPPFLKERRKGLRYLVAGTRLNRDTVRMILAEFIFGAAQPAGWVMIAEPNDKERRFCARLGLELVEADVHELAGLAEAAAA